MDETLRVRRTIPFFERHGVLDNTKEIHYV
jgi:hypothetical protein